MAAIKFQLYLPAVFKKEGDWIVGYFPHLDVGSQGRDQQEAERNLIEAAQLFIGSCFERNVLDEVLKNCGFLPGHLPQGADVGSDSKLPHLTVPFELLAARNASPALTC